MNKISLLAMGAVLSAGTAASADFLSFEGDINEVGDYTVISMYAVYDTNDVALNVFNATVSTSDAGGFNQSDVQIGAGGTWAPNASLDIPGFSDSSIDSFATIGYGVGAESGTNGSALDPSFLDATGGLGGYVPANAGWYNGNPTNNQTATGQAGFDFAVFVGQFSFLTSRVAGGDANFFTFDCEMGSKDAGGQVFFGSDTFIWSEIPAPGALALLGLGGLAARRRRG